MIAKEESLLILFEKCKGTFECTVFKLRHCKKVNFFPIFSFLCNSLLLFIVKGGKRWNVLLIVTFLVFLDLKIVFALL